MHNDSGKVTIVLRQTYIIAALMLAIVAILVGHALTLYLQYGLGYDYAKGFVPLFYFNNERNIPSFFSSALLLAGAGGFFILDRIEVSIPRTAKHWLVLSIIFVFLAFDESAGIHELLIYPVRETFNTSGIFFYAWILPYGLAIVLIGLYVLPPLLRVNSRYRNFFFLAAAVYIAGVIGLEMVGGAYIESNNGEKDLVFEALTTVEELLEMTGLVLLIYTQLGLASISSKRLAVRIS